MSLYWILALTVTLLACITAKPTASPTKLYSEIEILIKDMKNNTCAEENSTFYSPSGSKKCTIKALDCSIKELEKVRTECFDNNPTLKSKVYKTRDIILHLLKKMNITLQSNPGNCFCEQEKPKEKLLPEFFDNILKLLQMLNSSKKPNEA